MCGISGYVSATEHPVSVLKAMTDAIAHRGPDSDGQFLHGGGDRQWALGHRRLSILDLSEAGRQPMSFEHLTVAFNGEIYNHLEIRRELAPEGYAFTSSSDTETLLKAYHRWGKACLDKFIGMFAIALLDRRENRLFLARDRMGIKPLYYYSRGGEFAFASELKSLMRFPGFKKEINFPALNTYFTRRYITGPDSVFKDTYKLEPGRWLEYDGRSQVSEAYWSLSEKFTARRPDGSRSESDYLDELDGLVNTAVKDRLLSDVPLGAFLSGGIDSSLVTAVMQKVSSDPIQTFSIGFHEKGYDEAGHACKVAEHLGTDHHEFYIGPKDIEDLIPSIPDIYDEPFSDTSMLPTVILSQFTRKHVTVALSGDGGDELFCGYGHYAEDKKNQKHLGWGRLLHPLAGAPLVTGLLDKVDRRFLKFLHFQDKDAMVNSHYTYAEKVYFDNLIRGVPGRDHPAYYEWLSLTDDIQEKHMLQDFRNFLPEDILTKVDRATMKVALEARVPLLDHRIVEYSFNVPHRLKDNGGNLKYLLKELCYRYVPRPLLERPKAGFVAPIEVWLRSSLAPMVDKYLGREALERQGIFDPAKVAGLVRRSKCEKGRYFSWFVWSLLMFQLWHERYLD